MQYGVYIDQAAVAGAGLADVTDVSDWLLIEYLRCWWTKGRGRTLTRNGRAFYWLNYRHAIEQNPLLPFRTKSSLSRRISKLADLGILDVVVAANGTVYARPGAKLEAVDRLRGNRAEEGDVSPDSAADEPADQAEAAPEVAEPLREANAPDEPLRDGADSVKPLRVRNTCGNERCVQATQGVASAQRNQNTRESEYKRGARVRATSSLHAPSHKQPHRTRGRDPVTELHELAVAGIRARVPDFVDLCPASSRRALRDRAPAFGRDRVPKAPPNEQLAVGAQRVRELLAFLFASKRERLPLIRTLDESAWTVRVIVSANSMQTLVQHAGRRRPSSSRSMAEIAADFEARQAERAARQPNRIPPEIRAEIRKRASTRGRARASPTTNRGVTRLADTGTGPSVVFETVDRNRNGES